MDSKFTFALRKIALLGGMDDYVALASRELGDALEMSQQSASKRILELLNENLIVRDLGARRQRIKITPKGVEELKLEYNEYRRIFELADQVTLHGAITTGMGEGGYYICQPGYMGQLEEVLGFHPFEGTLNVLVDKEDLSKLDIVRGSTGHRINGFTQDGRSFGNVIAHKAKIRNIECAIVIPERSHYSNTIEIVCQYHLRRTLSLGDGDRIEVKINV
jgi:riboflavin kinase